MVNISYKITIKIKPYNLLCKGEEEEKMSFARGEKRFERSEWDCFTVFQFELILERRIHSWHIRARVIHTKMDQGGGDGI